MDLICDMCCSDDVYITDSFCGTKKVWICRSCSASVSCHVGTEVPLGRFADKATRKLRREAHINFDRLWKGGLMTREKAYAWLAGALRIEIEECHFSMLSKDALRQVGPLVDDLLDRSGSSLKRRAIKKEQREAKQAAREAAKQRKIEELARSKKWK